MKQQLMRVAGVVLLVAAAGAGTNSTIDSAHPYAYGANVGWINARGDVANGAVLGQYCCSGWMWGANIGWISLGAGTPANGYAYGNAAANDYGVNHDGAGALSGYAWAPNIGWIAFEQTRGQPRVDLLSGDLSGAAWSGNVGWISLNNTDHDYGFRLVTTNLYAGPDADADGLPDPWEYAHAGNLTALSGLAGHDADHDGQTDLQEYRAGTDPLNSNDVLRIVAFAANVVERTGTNWVSTWTGQPTRVYVLERATNLLSNDWTGVWGPAVGAAGSMSGQEMADTSTSRFYRVLARPPLSP